ncbi:MAG: hypothetical protein ACLVI9_00520 [Anaerostipes hadrus]
MTETKTASGKNLLKEPLVVTLPLSVTQAEVDKGNVDTSNAIKQEILIISIIQRMRLQMMQT